VLQRVVVCCSVLQCVAAKCMSTATVKTSAMCVAVGVLQRDTYLQLLRTSKICDAKCCGVMQCVTVRCLSSATDSTFGTCHAVYCSVLQCVVVCCSVLQCVAVCCSVL